MEILSHADGDIDMSRALDGLPLIVQHDNAGSLPVGRVVGISLDADRVLRGTLKFSQRAAAQAIRQDVLDGIVSDVSAGYVIDPKAVTKQGDTYRFRNWKPLEVSLVSIPADENAGINRGDPTVETETTETPAEETPTPAPTDELAIRQAFERFIARPQVADLQARMITAGASCATAQRALLDLLGAAGDPADGTATGTATPGEDAVEKFHRAAENAIIVRSGNGTEEDLSEATENPFVSCSIVELARQWAHLNHIDLAGLNAGQVIGRAIDPGTANLTTTDFPAILENVMNKSLFRGFDAANISYDQWCSVGGIADFKSYTRPGLSHFTSLALVLENAGITDGIRNDKKEGGRIQTYARKFSVTREAMVNDDLSAFSDNARAMGEAANRTVDENVYSVLELNDPMGEDAVALFSVATHANLVTPGGVPDEAAVIAAQVAMSAQVDSNSVALGINPAFSLQPVELRATMQKLAGAEYSPDGSANPFEPNAVRGSFVPVTSHLITDKNSWYMMGPRGTTFEVNFLNGQRAPSLERDSGWSTFALHWRVWIDFHVLPIDWRAAYKDEGGV